MIVVHDGGSIFDSENLLLDKPEFDVSFRCWKEERYDKISESSLMFPSGMGMTCSKVREQLLYATLGSEGESVPVSENTSLSYCHISENLLLEFARDPIVPSVSRDRDISQGVNSF